VLDVEVVSAVEVGVVLWNTKVNKWRVIVY